MKKGVFLALLFVISCGMTKYPVRLEYDKIEDTYKREMVGNVLKTENKDFLGFATDHIGFNLLEISAPNTKYYLVEILYTSENWLPIDNNSPLSLLIDNQRQDLEG